MVRVLVARSAGTNSMYVTTEAGKRYPLYMAATQFEHSEVARFGYVEREGLKPIIGITGPGLRSLTFSHRIASGDYRQSIEHVITPLTNLAKAGLKVRFVGGSSAYEQSVWWRILDLPVQAEQRAADNRISRATLTWTLEEAGALPTNLTRTVPKPAPPKPVVKKAAPSRTHRVVRGDTLWWLAHRYLGNPLRWPELYRANSTLIRNPNLILIGWVLKIPAR